MVPQLGYWRTRMLGQPIRLVLAYTGTDFEDIKYEVGDPPHYDKTCWLSVKHNLDLDFPNLPYYIEGDTRISQSLAIIGHLARKHGLHGATEQDQIKVDMLLFQACDLVMGFVELVFRNGYSVEKEEKYFAELQPKLQQFSRFLGDKPWFVGQYVTVADFLLYEFLDQHREVRASYLDHHPTLNQFMARVEALPTVRRYMASPAFQRRPVFNKYYAIEQYRRKLAGQVEGDASDPTTSRPNKPNPERVLVTCSRE